MSPTKLTMTKNDILAIGRLLPSPKSVAEVEAWTPAQVESYWTNAHNFRQVCAYLREGPEPLAERRQIFNAAFGFSIQWVD